MAIVTPLKLDTTTAVVGRFAAGDYVTTASLGSGTANSTTYLRGDSTWQTLNAAAVGLGNVTNESKATMFTNPTFTGTVTVGNTTSSNIVMVDTDEGNRTIHCNSNRIGFLTAGGGWGAWCDDNGNWGAVGSIAATGSLSGTYVSALSAGSSFYQVTITKPNGEAHIYFKGDNSRYLYSNPSGFQFSHHTYAPTLGATVATGTAPLSITSTTVCSNLNADMVDGYHATTAATASTVAVRDASGILYAANINFGTGNPSLKIRHIDGHDGGGVNYGSIYLNYYAYNSDVFIGSGSGTAALYVNTIYSYTSAGLTVGLTASNPRLTVSATAPELVLYSTSGTANQRKGRIIMGDGYLYIDIVNDALSARWSTWSMIIGYNILYSNTDNACYLGSNTYRWISVHAVNGTIQTSDANKKREIIDTPLGLDFILDLKPKAYKWKDGPDKERIHHGLLAQDVKESTKKHGEFGGLYDTDGLNYSEFVAPLIRSIHQLNEKLAALEARV